MGLGRNPNVFFWTSVLVHLHAYYMYMYMMNDMKNQDCYLKTKKGNKDMKVSQAKHKHVVIYRRKRRSLLWLNNEQNKDRHNVKYN